MIFPWFSEFMKSSMISLKTGSWYTYPSEKNISQWEGLSHIFRKINAMSDTTNHPILGMWLKQSSTVPKITISGISTQKWHGLTQYHPIIIPWNSPMLSNFLTIKNHHEIHQIKKISPSQWLTLRPGRGFPATSPGSSRPLRSHAAPPPASPRWRPPPGATPRRRGRCLRPLEVWGGGSGKSKKLRFSWENHGETCWASYFSMKNGHCWRF